MDYHGLMTRGVPTPPKGLLPFDDFPMTWRRVVVDACREAWSRLSDAAKAVSTSMASFSEDEITGRLKTILNDMRCQDPPPIMGFSTALFETVVRDAVVSTYNGSSLGKKPDLVFRPIEMEPGMWLSEYRGLFTECKIIDKQKHAIGLYCGKGLKRFVEGEYAWAMPSGLMLGYARENRRVDTTLRNALKRAQDVASGDEFDTITLPKQDTRFGSHPVAYVSVHRRNWNYSTGEPPGNVELIHLWLS